MMSTAYYTVDEDWEEEKQRVLREEREEREFFRTIHGLDDVSVRSDLMDHVDYYFSIICRNNLPFDLRQWLPEDNIRFINACKEDPFVSEECGRFLELVQSNLRGVDVTSLNVFNRLVDSESYGGENTLESWEDYEEYFNPERASSKVLGTTLNLLICSKLLKLPFVPSCLDDIKRWMHEEGYGRNGITEVQYAEPFKDTKIHVSYGRSASVASYVWLCKGRCVCLAQGRSVINCTLCKGTGVIMPTQQHRVDVETYNRQYQFETSKSGINHYDYCMYPTFININPQSLKHVRGVRQNPVGFGYQPAMQTRTNWIYVPLIRDQTKVASHMHGYLLPHNSRWEPIRKQNVHLSSLNTFSKLLYHAPDTLVEAVGTPTKESVFLGKSYVVRSTAIISNTEVFVESALLKEDEVVYLNPDIVALATIFRRRQRTTTSFGKKVRSMFCAWQLGVWSDLSFYCFFLNSVRNSVNRKLIDNGLALKQYCKLARQYGLVNKRKRPTQFKPSIDKENLETPVDVKVAQTYETLKTVFSPVPKEFIQVVQPSREISDAQITLSVIERADIAISQIKEENARWGYVYPHELAAAQRGAKKVTEDEDENPIDFVKSKQPVKLKFKDISMSDETRKAYEDRREAELAAKAVKALTLEDKTTTGVVTGGGRASLLRKALLSGWKLDTASN